MCGAAGTQIVDIVGRADQMVMVGGLNYYPQEVGDSLLAFPELARPPRFTLRTEDQADAQVAILDVEVAGELGAEEGAALSRRIAEGVSISRYWQVRLGAVRVEVRLHRAGSLERPFAYKHTPGAVGE